MFFVIFYYNYYNYSACGSLCLSVSLRLSPAVSGCLRQSLASLRSLTVCASREGLHCEARGKL